MSDLERFVARPGPDLRPGPERAARGPQDVALDVVRLPADRRARPSPTSVRYALASLDEARAYLDHPVLGARLRECTQIVADLSGLTAFDIFGGIDALKLHSSMTLFAHAAPDDPLFKTVLDRYFDAQADPNTLDRI